MRSLYSTTGALLVGIAATASYAQVAIQQGMTADSHCKSSFCVTAVYSPQTQSINYTLVLPRSPSASNGWWAIGQGSGMRGANMAINWINTDGSKTTSHRSASGEVYPTEEQAASLPALTINNDVQSTSASETVWSWSFAQPQPPNSNMRHIFAKSSQPPMGSLSSSGIPFHDDTDSSISLDMTKSYDGAAPAGLAVAGGITTSTTSLPSNYNPYRDLSIAANRIFLVHMIFMVLAWMLFLPIGILFARYGRNLFTWFPTHRAIMSGASIFVLIAFSLAIYGVSSAGGQHFATGHAKSGLILFIVLCLQGVLGGVSHWYRGKTGRRWIGYIHMPLGIIMIAWSVVTIHLGFGVWPWNAPNAVRYFLYAWSGFLALLYAAGFLFFRKGRSQSKEEEKSGELSTDS